MHGFSIVGGVVKLNLYQVVQDLTEPEKSALLKRIVVGRIAMSETTFAGVVGWMNSLAESTPSIQAIVKQSDGKE